MAASLGGRGGHSLVLALACWFVAYGAAAQTPTPPDAIEKLVVRLEQALAAGDRAALISLAVKDSETQGMFKPGDAADLDYRYVVMPMKF